MKFKIGDKVRYKESTNVLRKGGVYIVSGFVECKSFYEDEGVYGVKLEGQEDTSFWWNYRFDPVEPDLVFPFTIQSKYGDAFTVNQATDFDKVKITCHANGDISVYDNVICKTNARVFIATGLWNVASVGNQPSYAEGSYNDIKRSTSPSEDIGTLTVKVDATEALRAVKGLAEAVHEVNIALLAMQDIMAGIGLTQQAVSVSCWDDFKIGGCNV